MTKTQRYTLQRRWEIPGDMDLAEAVDEARACIEEDIDRELERGFRLLQGPFVETVGDQIVCSAVLRGPTGLEWTEEDAA